MVTLTQLEYIVALDDLRHFAAAADKCFVNPADIEQAGEEMGRGLGGRDC